MSGRNPAEIWEQSAEEGERRLSRGTAGLAATGLVGGIDVMLGIVALVVLSGALAAVMPEETAHVLGSLAFGIGFVLILVGRSELFTENFLVPIAAVIRRESTWRSVGRLWIVTLLGNLVGLLVLAYVLTRAGLVPPSALEAASSVAETFADRDALGALLSAVVAGTVMTLMTWLAHAITEDTGRILLGLLIGFLLAAPSLNHAVVSVGEMSLGILAGHGHAEWGDLAQNFPIAVAGNLIGGLGFVTITRLVQAYDEPD